MSSAPEPAPAAPSGSDDRGASRALDALRTLLIPGEDAGELGRPAPPLRADAPPASRGRHQRPAALGLARPLRRVQHRGHPVAGPGRRPAPRGHRGRHADGHRLRQHRPRQRIPRDRPYPRLPGLRKAEAQAVYRACQAQEQAWREKRRVRDLEELRAKSGGIQLAGGHPCLRPATTTHQPAARLQRAREMLQQGLLTDAEFEQVKSRILGDL
jgi:hypothetical protein